MKSTMKFFTYGLIIFSLVITSCAKDGEVGPMGPAGTAGIDGTNGEDGNANVQSFDIYVNKEAWSENLHFGGNNEYRNYTIPADSVGGVELNSFYGAGNVILTYAKPSYASDADYGTQINIKPLPYTSLVSGVSGSFGLLIDYAAQYGSFTLAKTVNGYEPDRITEAEIPDTIEFRIVLIEASNTTSSKSIRPDILNELKSAEVDINDYYAVCDYYGICKN